MAENNNENTFPTGADGEDSEPKAVTPAEDTQPEVADNDEGHGDNWQWDASVPETATDSIEIDELETLVKTEDAEKENTEEQSEEDETSENEGVCIVCGNKLGKSPSDLYCEECRKKFLRTDYGVGHIILAFVMVLVAAIGYFVCVSTCDVSDKLVKAQSYISDKRYDDAVNQCSEISNTINTINSGINAVFQGINENFSSKPWLSEGTAPTKLVVEAYCDILTFNTDQFNTFISAVDSSYTEKQLNRPKNAKIKACYDYVKEYNTFSATFSEKWQGYIYGDESEDYVIPYDTTIKYLDSIETTDNYQKSILEYYKFMTAYYAKKDADVYSAFFKNSYELAGDFQYLLTQNYVALAWQLKDYDTLYKYADESISRNANNTTAYYYSVKARVANEEFDKAIELCDAMKKTNPDGLDYYYMKAEILRRQSKFEDAVAICKEGIKAGSSDEIYRQEAIAYMLLEDKDSALDAAKECYDIALQNAYAGTSVSLESMNTAALIAFLCDDTDTYDEIVSLFKQENLELDDTVQNCIKGETTFEDIFMNGSGDIS